MKQFVFAAIIGIGIDSGLYCMADLAADCYWEATHVNSRTTYVNYNNASPFEISNKQLIEMLKREQKAN